jgi:hypothetical protein
MSAFVTSPQFRDVLKLRDEAKNISSTAYASAETKIGGWHFLDKSIETKARTLLSRANEQMSRNTYGDYLGALVTIREAVGWTEDRAIRITRTNNGLPIPYSVFLDDKKVGTVTLGATTSIWAQPGPHSIQIRTGQFNHIKSEVIKFFLENGTNFMADRHDFSFSLVLKRQ